MRLRTLLIVLLAADLLRAQGERLPIGEFAAPRLTPAPTIDGRAAPGEWDRALTTSGLVAPFDWQLQQAETTVSLGWDEANLYFLFRCRRGNEEWQLRKSARENDAYDFGDSSVEIWVTPPALVPETYQTILNTYPAVFDCKMVPSRGYTAQGWQGHWRVAASESATDYVIEASVPAADFGTAKLRAGDLWRFLLARNAPGAKPRSQASWSITQAFAEIPQHPPVRLVDDQPAVQLLGVTSVFTGRYRFPMAVAAPAGTAANVQVGLRIQKGKTPAGDDVVQTRTLDLAAGERQAFDFAGDVTAMGRGAFTLTATSAGQTLFRQSLPFEVNGWQSQPPQPPAGTAPPQPLEVTAQFGPETRTVLVRADILAMAERDKAASATLRVLDGDRVLATGAMMPFRQSYATGTASLAGVTIPTADLRTVDGAKTPPKPVKVEVVVKDAAGQPLATALRELNLLTYDAAWMRNDVGQTDRVIAPWTPVTVQGSRVGIWNRTLDLDGLGLARSLANGGVSQLAGMSLVATIGGREMPLRAPTGAPKRSLENQADLEGVAEAGGLRVRAKTRVEFDGHVLCDWNIAPGAVPVQVDKLELRITLPAAEATHFCSTSGGWAAVHDMLPDHWTSQSVSSGLLQGDFVPYIWLTNSDRAFLWFADSDRGWFQEPDRALPTQEIVRRDGKVTLYVRLIETPTLLDKPTNVVWGWQAFPSRPLPPGWRATFCAQQPPVPHTANTYFWTEADWAVLWPYYCSPYPWHMDKSREVFDRTPRDSLHRPCVGSIAHSVGRYRDYAGNEFPSLAVDWGAEPGTINNSDVTSSRGPNDFRLWHYQEWVRQAGFRGLYVDENYLSLESNFLTGKAYFRPDGGLQRAYNYLGLRDYFKRMKVMFAQNNAPAPNVWQHISSGAAYHAWFGDVFYEGENVEPTDLNFDYLEVLPAGRLRAIGSSVCAGGVMTMMNQADRHRTVHAAKHIHQLVGWCLAHDVMPEAQGNHWPALCEAGRLYEPGVRFRPYWKADTPAKTITQGALVSLHSASDRHVAWVVNTNRAAAKVGVSLDYRALALDPKRDLALDLETGAALTLTGQGLAIDVPERDWRAVLLVRRGALAAGQTFSASFTRGAEAEQALGSAAVTRVGTPWQAAGLATGRDGGGAAVGAGLQISGYLNAAEPAGSLSFDGQLAEGANGPLLRLGRGLTVTLRRGQAAELVLQAGDRQVASAAPGAAWHAFEVVWNAGSARLVVDGRQVGEIPRGELGFAPAGLKYEAIAPVVFDRGLATIDNVRLGR
ncbi:MAG: hypothetical protein HZB16_08275 [Armatimonadetes bacterium]|nr:hypothetical protein [Armatimonadota bacterium]